MTSPRLLLEKKGETSIFLSCAFCCVREFCHVISNVHFEFQAETELLFFDRRPVAFAGRGVLRLTRLPRHDRGPVPEGNRSAASCLCTVLRRALYHYSTRSPKRKPNCERVSRICVCEIYIYILWYVISSI